MYYLLVSVRYVVDEISKFRDSWEATGVFSHAD